MKQIAKKYKFELKAFGAGMIVGLVMLAGQFAYAVFFSSPPITTETNQQVGALGVATGTVASTIRVVASSTEPAILTEQATSTNSGLLADFRNSVRSLFNISNTGRVGVGTTTPGKDFSVSGNGGIITGELTTETLIATSSAILAKQSGGVGIGTTTPGTKLGVDGNINATGTTTAGGIIARNTLQLGDQQMRVPTTKGTNNQVWTTDGNNQTSWNTVSADINLVASSTASVATSTMGVGGIPKRNHYIVKFYAPSHTNGQTIWNIGAPASGESRQTINDTHTTTTNQANCMGTNFNGTLTIAGTAEIHTFGTNRIIANYRFTEDGGAGVAPNQVVADCTLSTTSNTLDNISWNFGAGQGAAGTNIAVYASSI